MLHETPEELRRRRKRKDVARPGADALGEVAELQAEPGEDLGAPTSAPLPDLPGPGVRCPYCHSAESEVRKVWDLKRTYGIRRRSRICLACRRPYTSTEYVDSRDSG